MWSQTRVVPAPGARTLAILLASVVVLAAGPSVARAPASAGRAPATRTAATKQPSDTNQVRLQVEHTLFHPMDGVVLHVEQMDGYMVGKPGMVISLDDPNSFSVQLDQAVTRLSARDLSALINSYLLQQADSAVRHVDISFEGQQVVLRGQVHKLINLPFTGRGMLSATPDGELRMHLAEFRVAGVLSKDFLALLGIRLDDVTPPRHKASFRVQGSDIIVALNELFPPPRVFGRLTGVHVENQDLVQVIGVPASRQHALLATPQALPKPSNYMYFSGGRLRFGRMTMDNVDLKLVDKTPETAFDFSLAHYQEQIQAGYVQVLPNLGVIAYAESWGKLSAHKRK